MNSLLKPDISVIFMDNPMLLDVLLFIVKLIVHQNRSAHILMIKQCTKDFIHLTFVRSHSCN